MSVDDACGCSGLSHFELLETVGTPAIAECLSNTLRDLFCFAHDPDSRPTLYLRGRRHSSEISPRSVPDKRGYRTRVNSTLRQSHSLVAVDTTTGEWNSLLSGNRVYQAL